MNFVAIDFETANHNLTSACSLGLVNVINNMIEDKKSWLIKPYPFKVNKYNFDVNGLGEDVLIDKPFFCDVWDEIYPYIENNLVIAHNASFDISVLLHTLKHYNIEIPNFSYICTYKASKQLYCNLLNYRLDTIADYLGLDLNHHEASSDAEVTAKIFLDMLYKTESNNIKSFLNNFCIDICLINKDTIVRESGNKFFNYNHIRACNIKSSKTEFDIDNEFYNKKIVFTGQLTNLTRKDAYQLIADLGGIPQDDITKETNYLVLGTQDYKLLKGNLLSSKTKKALNYLEKGTGIQIITENDFIKLVGCDLIVNLK